MKTNIIWYNLLLESKKKERKVKEKKLSFCCGTVVNDPVYLCGRASSIPGLVQWIKDSVLLHLWCMSQLQLGFDPFSGKFFKSLGWPKWKKKKKKRKENSYKQTEVRKMAATLLHWIFQISNIFLSQMHLSKTGVGEAHHTIHTITYKRIYKIINEY